MATKKQNTRGNTLRNWQIIAVASLAINILFVVTVIVSKSNVLDTARINNAVEIMCSSDFRDKTKERDDDRALAILDYNCAQNGAETYYEDGAKKFFESRGIEY